MERQCTTSKGSSDKGGLRFFYPKPLKHRVGVLLQVMDLRARRLFKSIRGAHSNIASSVAFRAHRPWELISGGMDQMVCRCVFV